MNVLVVCVMHNAWRMPCFVLVLTMTIAQLLMAVLQVSGDNDRVVVARVQMDCRAERAV